jgi:Ni,Fe-hydrogenase III large subunit
MNIDIIPIEAELRQDALLSWLNQPGKRLGLITSIDGGQIVTLLLDTADSAATLWESKISDCKYNSLTPRITQAHWMERTMWDMFGLEPNHHPRLKHNLLHEPYEEKFYPLRKDNDVVAPSGHRQYHSLKVKGDGIYEIPVGPIHAGIIEPGHFHFSCVGEIIFNLEIRLGYVHRGIEKRLAELNWKKQRFLVEAAASDSAAAYALAHAVALESSIDLIVPEKAQHLRSLALEIERVAMHISDLTGLAADVGFLAISSSLGRLRGASLGMAELVSGNRFLKGFICPGGVIQDPDNNLSKLKAKAKNLQKELEPVIRYFLTNQVVLDRMENIGKVSERLAKDFGLVGVAGRASNQEYDARHHFSAGVYPLLKPAIVLETEGDVFCRAKVRVAELVNSLAFIDMLLETMPSGLHCTNMPDVLRANAVGLGIVEAHRGELIHLVFTDEQGNCKRYAIKDPSVNNWTGLAIAARNNLVSDFPLCNKSFSLSYSGHDL